MTKLFHVKSGNSQRSLIGGALGKKCVSISYGATTEMMPEVACVQPGSQSLMLRQVQLSNRSWQLAVLTH